MKANALGKKFYIYAAISSPFMAIHAAFPFYVFGVFTPRLSLELFLSLLLSMVMYWGINGYLFLYLRKKTTWYTILLSYLFTFLSNALKLPFTFLASSFDSILLNYVIYPIATTIALNTIILIIIHLLIQERAKEEAKDRIAELSIQKLKAENQALTQQLQPHFLFNALSVLKSLIREDADLAEDYTLKLSDFLRYGVESQQADLVSLKEEMDFVSNYLSLQKIRFEEAITYEVNIPNEQLERHVPVFAVQTLVENACKHNYFTEKSPLHIAITGIGEELSVRNNLVSLKLTERSGTGLHNLSKRYQFLAAKDIHVQQSETEFCVTLPLI